MKNNYIETESQRKAESNKNTSRHEHISDKELDIAQRIEPSHGENKETKSQLKSLAGNKMTSPKGARKSVSNILEKQKERSMLLNIQGNYDAVLNRNLVSNNNKILDDSILEVFFYTLYSILR